MAATPDHAACAAASVAADAVVYLSSFENHPRAVSALASGSGVNAPRALWGNMPQALARVRDPVLLAATLRRRGCAAPRVGRAGDSGACDHSDQWLLKPLRSGGGHGIRRWQPGRHVPANYYLQERIEGVPGSIVFVAAGGRARALAMTRQLIGDRGDGGDGFRYCGNILAAVDDAQFTDGRDLMQAACELAEVVADEFGLVGVNGIDFIAHGPVPYAIEVNPRWTGAMEVVERGFGISIFGMHAEACSSGVLPVFDLAAARHIGGAVGKMIVFAPCDAHAGDTRAWLEDPDIRDVPHPGEHFAAGAPVCTVFATGTAAESCHQALLDRADRIRLALKLI
jgi:predicted ATP-grasp superfamily ATP-dependent carboligase